MKKGTANYIVGEVPQFDQRNEMFKREIWQPEWRDLQLGHRLEARQRLSQKEGYTRKERALEHAGWSLEAVFAKGNKHGGHGLYAWESFADISARIPPFLPKAEFRDPAEASALVKKAARFSGACLAGICKLDRRWVYSHEFDGETGEHRPINLPPEMENVVVLAIEMDYYAIKAGPTAVIGAGTGIGYSMMAFTALVVAEFIRGLGYKAIPSGNDTALSVPLAIDAGLGELGRNGLLITEEYGPRVRLAKVFTDLPLAPDPPRGFGVLRFCETCKTCAKYCPGQSIPFGERTTEPANMSNSPGLLRWPMDGEKCSIAWAKTGSCCGVCIRVCPFNKQPGVLHEAVRWGVRYTPLLNPVFVWADKKLGYHRALKPRDFWRR